MNEAQKRAVEVQAKDLFDFNPMQYMTTYVTSWARLNKFYPEVADNYRIEACANLLHLQREARVVLLAENQRAPVVRGVSSDTAEGILQSYKEAGFARIQPIVEE